MNASPPRRARNGRRPQMDRASADRLLDGDLAGSAMRDDRLVRLLTAAAAPGRDRELAGEQTAVAAFTQQLAPAAGPAAPPSARSPWARLRSFKALGLAAACSWHWRGARGGHRRLQRDRPGPFRPGSRPSLGHRRGHLGHPADRGPVRAR